MIENYHKSVLLKESVDGLCIKEDGVYVDITFGGGGHSREILRRLSDKGRLFAFDQDGDALANEIEDERFTLINENFRFLKKYLRFYGVSKVDGVLGDLGVSSHQFDQGERGFSTRFEGELDMRMNTSEGKSAKDVVNSYSAEDLSNVFYKYGELNNSRLIAKEIERQRNNKVINTTTELKEVVSKFLPKGKENKVLAQIYQAIRIEVNDEMSVLEEMLMQLGEVVREGGRISVISYHSLEDRLIKRYIRDGKFEGEAEKDFYGNSSAPFKRIGNFIEAREEEVRENPRARSAKLRIAERVNNIIA